jgi:hypothetical protein
VCSAEICILQNVDQKKLGTFELWCWRRMEKIISCIDRVRDEVIHRVRKKKMSYMLKKEGSPSELFISCVVTAF